MTLGQCYQCTYNVFAFNARTIKYVRYLRAIGKRKKKPENNYNRGCILSITAITITGRLFVITTPPDRDFGSASDNNAGQLFLLISPENILNILAVKTIGSFFFFFSFHIYVWPLPFSRNFASARRIRTRSIQKLIDWGIFQIFTVIVILSLLPIFWNFILSLIHRSCFRKRKMPKIVANGFCLSSPPFNDWPLDFLYF